MGAKAMMGGLRESQKFFIKTLKHKSVKATNLLTLARKRD